MRVAYDGSSNSTRYSLGLLLVLAFGCGSDDEEEEKPPGTAVGCDWFAGDNCWKAAVASARSCLDEANQGTLSADRKSCEYADGTVVTSPTPLPVDLDDDYLWELSVSKNGQQCMAYHDLAQDNGMELVTAAGTFSERVIGMNMILTCPDGKSYHINGLSALSCGIGELPGHAYSVSGSYVVFTLLGGNPDAELLDCQLGR